MGARANMKIKTTLTLHRRQWTKYSRNCPRGSGYCHDQGVYRCIIKRWIWRGIVLWSREIDREDEPVFVWIAAATIGPVNWKSKFDGMPGVFWPDGKPA